MQPVQAVHHKILYPVQLIQLINTITYFSTVFLGGTFLVYEVAGLEFGEGYLFTVATISQNISSIPMSMANYITVCKLEYLRAGLLGQLRDCSCEDLSKM